MKYRYLTDEELKLLEKDFLQFLISNDIDNEEWLRLNSDYPDNALKIVGIFSDIVIEKALQNIEFLEYRTPKSLKIFHCKKEKIVLIGLDIDENSDLDLTKQSTANIEINEFGDAIKSYKTSKKYSSNREEEIYKMMDAGCYVVNGKFFHSLNQLRQVSQN